MEGDVIAVEKPSSTDDYLGFAQYWEYLILMTVSSIDYRHVEPFISSGGPADIEIKNGLREIQRSVDEGNESSTYKQFAISNFKVTERDESKWTAKYDISFEGNPPEQRELVVVKEGSEWKVYTETAG